MCLEQDAILSLRDLRTSTEFEDHHPKIFLLYKCISDKVTLFPGEFPKNQILTQGFK